MGVLVQSMVCILVFLLPQSVVCFQLLTHTTCLSKHPNPVCLGGCLNMLTVVVCRRFETRISLTQGAPKIKLVCGIFFLFITRQKQTKNPKQNKKTAETAKRRRKIKT